VGRITNPETKPLAIVDSNILIYALNTDYADQKCHEKCLSLLDRGLKGQLPHTLALNPIIVAEVFTAIKKLLGCNEAESRMSGLLQSKRLGYVSISKEACQIGVQWAKEQNVPVNDALIAACAEEQAPTIYTNDEEHYKKLQTHNITIINPTTTTL
jgi:predicted nucleic acid-binding protein